LPCNTVSWVYRRF